MHVAEVAERDRAAWDAFVRASPVGSFLQSWRWGDFQRAAGFRILRLMIRREAATNDIEAVCLLVYRSLLLGRSYLVAPWGPVFRSTLLPPAGAPDEGARAFGAFTRELRARMAGSCVFAHLEPKLPAAPRRDRVLAGYGYRPHARSIQPAHTLVVHLTQSEDELLRAMHPKTRYNIRVASRSGVTVAEQTDTNGLDAFLALAQEVERKGRFRYHPAAYYGAMLETLKPQQMLRILVARHNGNVLAASLLVSFGDTVTYAHGASSQQKKHVMAPYLLHWEGMLRARAAGARRYDFFGIAPPGASVAHPWFGITRFKQGFGGVEEHYIGAADLVGDPALYRAYEVGRGLRALLR